MAATNAHTFNVTDQIQVYSITKDAGDKVTVSFNFAAGALASGVTVASASAATITPVDGTNAPTASAPAVDGSSHSVSTVIDAGLPAWNTTGTGRVKFTATYSNGDKREIDLNVTIVQL